MKNLLLQTLIIMLTATTLLANDNDSQLYLALDDNQPFTIYVNDKPVNYVTRAHTLKLKPGSHKIKIVKYRVCDNGYIKRIPHTYYMGQIDVPKQAKVVAIVGKYNHLDMLNYAFFNKQDDELLKKQNLIVDKVEVDESTVAHSMSVSNEGNWFGSIQNH